MTSLFAMVKFSPAADDNYRHGSPRHFDGMLMPKSAHRGISSRRAWRNRRGLHSSRWRAHVVLLHHRHDVAALSYYQCEMMSTFVFICLRADGRRRSRCHRRGAGTNKAILQTSISLADGASGSDLDGHLSKSWHHAFNNLLNVENETTSPKPFLHC